MCLFLLFQIYVKVPSDLRSSQVTLYNNLSSSYFKYLFSITNAIEECDKTFLLRESHSDFQVLFICGTSQLSLLSPKNVAHFKSGQNYPKKVARFVAWLEEGHNIRKHGRL